MPEFRKDPITDRWVIIASERADRPSAFAMDKLPKQTGYCPFCAGNEDDTPGEVLAYRPFGSVRDNPDWWLRVVPNKYPALLSSEPAKRSGDGMYDKINGMGLHEVVIETPDHDAHIATMELRQVEEIIWAYRDRSLAMLNDKRIEYVMIFKNYMREAGASLDHPHSQIIATPIIPKRVSEELEGSRNYFGYKKRCVFCDILAQEFKDRTRLLIDSLYFVAHLPYASRFPFECCIMPKDHAPYFHEIHKDAVKDLAWVLHEAMAKLRDTLNDPPFNWILHTAPLRQNVGEYYHWHLEIIPKMTRPAGFEWGTGFYINPFSPETACKQLLLHRASSLVIPSPMETNALTASPVT